MLADYLVQLRVTPVEPAYEPDVDDKDQAKDAKLRETDDLENGAVSKAVCEPGRGSASPAEGDLVYLHYSVRTLEGEVVETTRLDEGGPGIPAPFALGKGFRMPRGWELALQDAKAGERFLLRLKPSYGYAHKECDLQPPAGHSIHEAFDFDIQLAAWYPKGQVRVVGAPGNVYKVVLQQSNEWETLRPPFEADIWCTARIPSTSGQHCVGESFFTTSVQQPLHVILGADSLPAALEEALTTMAAHERAVISCPAPHHAAVGMLVPPCPPGVERVEYEVEVANVIQVRDMTGDGQVIKRRVKRGKGDFPMDCPVEDALVRIHYKGFLTDTHQLFVNTRGSSGQQPPLEFETGMGRVPEAIDMAVRLMVPGEVSLVRSSATYAYDSCQECSETCPEGAEVEWEVELVGFDKPLNWAAATASQLIERADVLKGQGNAVFRKGLLKHARGKWLKAIKLLGRHCQPETEEEEAMMARIKCACMLNMALLSQREDSFGEALDWCEKAMREDGNSAKAFYRRASILMLLGEYEKAERDFRQTSICDPSTQEEVSRELARMANRQKVATSRQRAQLRNFYNR